MVKRGISYFEQQQLNLMYSASNTSTTTTSPTSRSSSVDAEAMIGSAGHHTFADGSREYVVNRESSRQQFGITYTQENRNVLVSRIAPETPGARAGIPIGMRLRSVDGVEVRDLTDILPAISGKTTIRLVMEPSEPCAV